jgi:hypothetical protein
MGNSWGGFRRRNRQEGNLEVISIFAMGLDIAAKNAFFYT